MHGKRRQLPPPSLAAVAVVPQSVLHFRHSIFCWGTAVMRDKSLSRRSFLMSSTASLGGILALAAGTGRAAAFEVQNLGPGAPLALDIQNRCSALRGMRRPPRANSDRRLASRRTGDGRR